MKKPLNLLSLILILLTLQQRAIAQNNYVLNFDGNDYVNIGQDISTGVKSIEMWFKPEIRVDASNTQFYTLIGRGGGGPSRHEYSIGFAPSSLTALKGRLRFAMCDGIPNWYDVWSCDQEWNPGQWYHLVATIEASGDMKLYINGTFQSCTTSTTSTSYRNDIRVSTDDAHLGRWGTWTGRTF